MARPKIHENASARAVAALAARGQKAVTVQLSEEVLAALDEYRAFKDMSRSAVIERLIVTQLLRKR